MKKMIERLGLVVATAVTFASSIAMAKDVDICEHEGVLEVLSTIRGACTDGRCNIDEMVRNLKGKSLASDALLRAVEETDSVVFFFPKGSPRPTAATLKHKKEALKRVFRPARPGNTIAFIIGKASKTKGTKRSDRYLSSQRAAWVRDYLQKEGLIQRCKEVKVGYVGQEAVDVDSWNAKNAGYLTDLDISAIPSSENVDLYINQSASVIVFPCLKELCRFAKNKLRYSCDAGAQKRLFEECEDIVCGS